MTSAPPASTPELKEGVRRASRLLRAAGGKFGLLLLALVALLAATPLIVAGPVWNSVLALFTGAVLVAGLHAAEPGRRAVLVGLVLALADLTIGRGASLTGWPGLVLLQIVLWLATLIYVTAAILEAIFRTEVVTLETLQASLCVYLLLGLIGGFGFALIDFTFPGSFQTAHGPPLAWTDTSSREVAFMRLFVLSYGTLSGAGYPELAPATGFANNMASLEAMTGQIYLAVVIARLVGLHATPPPR